MLTLTYSILHNDGVIKRRERATAIPIAIVGRAIDIEREMGNRINTKKLCKEDKER